MEWFIDEFLEKFVFVYDEVVFKFFDQGIIYVMGYVYFFDDMINECDEVFFNVWGGVIGVVFDFQ